MVLTGKAFVPELGRPLGQKHTLLARIIVPPRPSGAGVLIVAISERLEDIMENRVAMIAIVVEDDEEAVELNSILHQYSQYIIGRMGIPHRERKISLISIAIDGPADAISALAGKLGSLPGVSAKTVYAKLEEQ